MDHSRPYYWWCFSRPKVRHNIPQIYLIPSYDLFPENILSYCDRVFDDCLLSFSLQKDGFFCGRDRCLKIDVWGFICAKYFIHRIYIFGNIPPSEYCLWDHKILNYLREGAFCKLLYHCHHSESIVSWILLLRSNFH